MSLLPRRASARESTPPPPPLPAAERARLEELIASPDTGSIKRRWLRRKLSGIVAIGAISSAPPPAPEPQPVVLASDGDGYAALVAGAVNALDAHVREINQRLDSGRVGDYEQQELLAEKRDLARARAQMLSDLALPAVLDSRQLQYLQFRCAESRENLWACAERASRAGEHRQARMWRLQALGAYREVEQELGVRHEPMRLGG